MPLVGIRILKPTKTLNHMLNVHSVVIIVAMFKICFYLKKRIISLVQVDILKKSQLQLFGRYFNCNIICEKKNNYI